MNTSIVIPLGTGSRWDNTELRYCLRSVEKHLTGYGDIFIIGEKPGWLKNVIHIPFDEGFAPKSYEKERNIFNKIMAACHDERVTGRFLFMNDDHFLLQEHEAIRFPFYCDSTLNMFLTVTDYKYTVQNTLEYFDGALVGNFDVHAPIVYHKEYFPCLSKADWSKEWGYCIKSMYCDINGIIGDKYPDLKINEPYPADKIHQLIAGRPWFSIGDRAREGDMLQVLQEIYPNKSKYE